MDSNCEQRDVLIIKCEGRGRDSDLGLTFGNGRRNWVDEFRLQSGTISSFKKTAQFASCKGMRFSLLNFARAFYDGGNDAFFSFGSSGSDA